jgi:[acyl-carrier-protein] S-malonyltransferase
VSNATEPAALFPGQGSHTPEMRDLVAQRAPELLERVIELVGEDPFARVEESTRYAQPAIFCASIAGWDALNLHPSAAAGHSLGELAALAAAGVLSRDDALELVVLRGRLMGEARNGSMLALVGASLEDAEAIAREGGVTVANDNAPGQVILSGSLDALDRTEAVASERGTRVIRLDVAGAFHSPAMEPAAAKFRAALERVELEKPQVPVFSGVTAALFDDFRRRLAEGIIRPVRWRETLLSLHGMGVQRFVEVGPGKVLTGLVKRTLPSAKAETLDRRGDAARG